MRRRTGVHADLAGGGNAQRYAFIGSEPRRLDRIRNTDADKAALLACLTLPLPEFGVTGRTQRGRLADGIIAAVIGNRPSIPENNADLIRHLFGLDEVAAAHFGGIKR